MREAEENSLRNIYFALENKLFYFNWRNQHERKKKKKRRQDSASEKLK